MREVIVKSQHELEYGTSLEAEIEENEKDSMENRRKMWRHASDSALILVVSVCCGDNRPQRGRLVESTRLHVCVCPVYA